VDSSGAVILNERIRPTVAIEYGAECVHGISAETLAGAPTWPDIADRVKAALDGKPVVAFNADFDLCMLAQIADAFGEPFISLETVCAMEMAAETFGATNRYGSISLADSVHAAGLDFIGEAHTAAGDALTTAALYEVMKVRLEKRKKAREYRARVAAKQKPRPII